MPSLIEDAIALKKGKLKAEDIRETRRKTVQQIADALDLSTIQGTGPVKRHTTVRGSMPHKTKAS